MVGVRGFELFDLTSSMTKRCLRKGRTPKVISVRSENLGARGEVERVYTCLHCRLWGESKDTIKSRLKTANHRLWFMIGSLDLMEHIFIEVKSH